MTDNTKIWDALKVTDPKYTKKVEFGRKFTSINSQWQLQRMTETFGPIGKGWGYSVVHSTEHIHPMYVLAVADVTIWWRDAAEDKVASYGPVRGSSPVLEPARDKGRLLMESDGETVKMHLDDDAGKKAMTDALTKGLSHLGLSADVFLGLFDDNKYVREVAQQYADAPKQIMHGEPAMAVQAANGDPVPPEDRHLLKNGETRSTYRVAADAKTPGRTNAEFWASSALTLFTQPGYDLLQYREWRGTPCTNKGTKTNDEKLSELREKYPDLAQSIDDAVSNLKVAVIV